MKKRSRIENRKEEERLSGSRDLKKLPSLSLSRDVNNFFSTDVTKSETETWFKQIVGNLSVARTFIGAFRVVDLWRN